MSENTTDKNASGYFTALTRQFGEYFKSILDDCENANELIAAHDSKTSQLLHLQSRKIAGIEEKVNNILQLYSLELDEFNVSRENLNLPDEITQLVKKFENAAANNNTVIEVQLSSDAPQVNLNRNLFHKWLFWCIGKLYRESAISHLVIATHHDDNGAVYIQLTPARVTGAVGSLWHGFDWICASRYFQQEKGDIVALDNQGLRIKLTPTAAATFDILSSTYEQPKTIVKRIRNGLDLPTLSPIATKIINMAVDERTSAQDIADIITLDPALTSKVLRVVNSPLYGFRKEITTLSQAVALLGMKAVRTLSLCISVVHAFPSRPPDGFSYSDYWQRSIAAAIACKLTAQKLKLDYDEEAFIGGLTQNVGSLVLSLYFPEQYGQFIKKHYTEDEDLVSLELKSLGIDHAKVGFEVFSLWKMPKVLALSILYHHEPEKVQSDDKRVNTLTRIIYLSDLVSRVLYERDTGSNLNKLKMEYKSIFGISGSDIDEIMEKVTREVETVAGEFELKINKPTDYHEIMHMANKKLESINLDYEQMNRELLKAKNKAEKLARELQKVNKQLEEQATTDGLTKLYNHRFFYDLLSKEFSNAARYKLSLSCVMMDLDFFKMINDSFGHQEGDNILKGLGKVLKQALRQGDSAARYGGEEFALLLPYTSRDDALGVADRIRKIVQNTAFTKLIGKGDVTISAGVACFENGNYKNPNQLVEMADKALYKAKQSGRNCVAVISTK